MTIFQNRDSLPLARKNLFKHSDIDVEPLFEVDSSPHEIEKIDGGPVNENDHEELLNKNPRRKAEIILQKCRKLKKLIEQNVDHGYLKIVDQPQDIENYQDYQIVSDFVETLEEYEGEEFTLIRDKADFLNRSYKEHKLYSEKVVDDIKLNL